MATMALSTLFISICGLLSLTESKTSHLNFAEAEHKLNCNFDGKTTCQWTQSTDDKFDWSTRMGTTPTDDTGPDTGHGGSGSYVFIESSAPRVENDKATLLSPVIDAWNHEYMCFKMFYYAYGADLGFLNVDLVYSHFKNTTIHETGSRPASEQAWKEVKFTIYPDAPFQVAVTGSVGNGYLGDIAIDDISVTSGAC
ncbi:MAM domain-containing glycosylphosphatidylinositol anchor protein 2-like [Mya arenaria]|uniref:MAM domain-containing glycosylphosphatidylinositol anchor protein 2-like n=1 Tax=Mya arenaria TaxID=6604 RepID=UPI0022E095DE|nr:MAM domain-containing glycosylphosphatidylinositol anchor protein 2-like [Mya arenaria]